jgi:hypothetical protein
MVIKTLHGKLKLSKTKPTNKRVNSGSPKRVAIHVSLVTPVVLHVLIIR